MAVFRPFLSFDRKEFSTYALINVEKIKEVMYK